MYRNRIPIPEAPDLDFDQKIVIAVSMGNKPSTGYSIEIKKLLLETNELEVKLELRSPGDNCIVGFAITNPIHIIQFDKIPDVTNLTYKFTKSNIR